jgi:hypothetical protein
MERSIPYDEIDVEVRQLVRDLNTISGMRTIDSCFGHSGTGKICNHNSEVFVGIEPTGKNSEKFNLFWRGFFKKYGGKTNTSTGWIQFTVVDYPYEPYPLTRLRISPKHDPSVDPRGIQEKKEGIEIMRQFIAEYNNHD